MNIAKFFSILIFAVAAGACSGSAAKGSAAADASAAEAASATASEFRTDSVSFEETVAVKPAGSVMCSIGVDYPKGESEVADSVRLWISDQLSYNPMGAAEGATAGYRGIADGQQLVDRVGRATVAMARNEIASMGADASPFSNYEYMWNIYVIYERPSFVTYGSQTYGYTGGAHGGSSFEGATFVMADGRLLGRDIFAPGSEAKLKGILKRALMADYFQVTTDDELRESLLVDPNDIPLPAASPYFTKDGVAFVYQQYEIAIYAAGLPSVTVPYSTLLPLMTEKARKLVE